MNKLIFFTKFIRVIASLIVIITPSLVGADYKVGRVCAANSECGENEFCQRFSFLSGGGCSKGKCMCQIGYARGSSGICSPFVNLSLGAPCTDSDNEIYPKYAICLGDVVGCSPNFVAYMGNCIADPAYKVRMYGEDCSNDAVCGGVGRFSSLSCDVETSRCVCGDQTYYYNAGKDDCIPRDFGDSCRLDRDCSANLYASSGYACVNGMCDCQDDHIAIAITSFNDTGVFTRTVCQMPTVSQRLSVGDICYVQPEAFSSSNDDKLCAPGLVCLRCPAVDIDDPTLMSYEGHCQATNSAPSTAVAKAATTSTTTTTTTTTTLTTSTVTVQIVAILSPVPRASATQATVASMSTSKLSFSKVGTACSDDANCATNEHCLKAVPSSQGLLDPPCRRGVCSCLDNYAPDKNGICNPYVFLPIGSPCSNAANELMPNNTYCSSARIVNCTAGMTLFNGICYTIVPSYAPPSYVSYVISPTVSAMMPPVALIGMPSDTFTSWRYRQYGENCNLSSLLAPGDLGCQPGLACFQVAFKGGVCSCARVNEMYSVRDGVCRPREFGDPCSRNEECQGWYSARGTACVSGRCGCDSGYIGIQAGIYNASAIIVRNICVPTGSTGNVGKGGACKVDSSAGNWCYGLEGLACFQCPEDVADIGVGWGRCRSGGPTYYYSGLKSKAYGQACGSDYDCMRIDGNTTCTPMSETFSPGCSRGTCLCATGAVLDPVDGYCYRQVIIPYNATCNGGSTIWENYPTAAYCDPSTKRVACAVGFMWVGFACMPTGSTVSPAALTVAIATPDSRTSITMTLTYGEFCGANLTRTAVVAGRQLPVVAKCDASKLLACDYSGRCTCITGYRWLASPSKNIFACVPRAYGDSCSVDADCYTAGSYSEPRLDSGAKCISGICLCDPVNYIRTDVLKQDSVGTDSSAPIYTAVAICLRRSIYHQYVELPPGQNCTLSPWQESSYGGYVRACAADSVCLQCPGDLYPTCQQPRSLTSDWFTQEPLPRGPTAYPLQYVQRTIGPLFENKIVLPWFYSEGNLTSCRNDHDCPFMGQACQIDSAFSPVCAVGACRCPDGQTVYQGSCQPIQQKRLHETCTTLGTGFNRTNEGYPLGALCRHGRVECANSASELQNAVDTRMHLKQISLRDGDNSCFSIKGLGEACTTNSDLCNPLQGLECLASTSTCGCWAGTFETIVQRCRYRFIGEACSKDEDCYPGYSLSARCARGICSCVNEDDVVEVRAYLGPLYPVTLTMKMCVTRGYYSMVNSGDSCSTAERIGISMQLGSAWSSSYWRRTQPERICSPGLTCLACDSTNHETGICTRFTGTNIEPAAGTQVELQVTQPQPIRMTEPPTPATEHASFSYYFSPNRPTMPPVIQPPVNRFWYNQGPGRLLPFYGLSNYNSINNGDVAAGNNAPGPYLPPYGGHNIQPRQ